jgi:hypothetical protein
MAQSVVEPTYRITVRVRQVAGSALYLDVGSAHGLAAGDTVAVARDSLGTKVGSLVVSAATETRSVLGFAGPPFPVTIGQPLTLYLLREPSLAVPEEARPFVTRAPSASGASPGGPPLTGSTAQMAPSAPTYGRVALDLAALRSATRSSIQSAGAAQHVFATPALALDVTAPRALAGFDLRAGARLAYRYADQELSAPAASARVYNAALERRFQRLPLAVTLGRFHSPDESYSGFWDGLRVRYGAQTGLGLLVGFQPDRWNESLSLERPKATLVLDLARRGRGWRWSGDLSTHMVSGGDSLSAHVFAGLSQSLVLGRVRLSQDLQVDREPDSARWRASRLALRSSLSLSSTLDLRVGFAHRETYQEWADSFAFAPREDRFTGGVTLMLGRGHVSADVSRSDDGSRRPALAYTASFLAPGLLPSNADLDGSASYWTGWYGSTWTAAPSVTLGGADTRLRVGYRLYRSDFLARALTTHAAEVGGDLALGTGRRASLRLRVQRGGGLASESLSLTLYRVF